MDTKRFDGAKNVHGNSCDGQESIDDIQKQKN